MFLHKVPEDFDASEWLTPSQAAAMVRKALASNDYVARTALLERLRGARVTSVAATTTAHGLKPERYGLMALGASTWNEVESDDLVWQTGDITYSERDPGSTYAGLRKIRHSTVRIDLDAVKALAEEFSLAAYIPPDKDGDLSKPMATAAANRGGRPRKEFWDDLWAEIARQLYAGELVPKKQSDIENAMADWLSKKRFDAGEQTIRRAARKLWAALKAEDQN